MTLFRREVLDARKNRLWGEVLVIQPLSHTALTLLLLIIVATAAAGLALGNFSRTETARGFLTPTEGLAEIYPLRPGVIEAVMVKEGGYVEAGQPLIRIRAGQHDFAGDDLEARQIALLQERLAAVEQSIDHAQMVSVDRAQQLASEINGLEREIAETQSRLAVQQRITASAEESFRDLSELVDKGFVAKSEFEQRRQNFLNQEAQEASIRQSLASLQTRLERARADNAMVPETEAETIRDLEGRRSDLTQQLLSLEGQRAFTLVAPIAGHVAVLQAYRGRKADPSRPLATILPKGSSLDGELYVPSRAIGFVKPGQQVQLQYDAFPYQRFGAQDAEIVAVSRTILSPDQVSGPLRPEEPVYRVTVRPTKQSIDAYGEPVPLQAGMTLNAQILIERRRFLSLLLDPLRALAGRT